ncbi:hypothetical protein [Nannocystis pusilla]|uniref:hypothetical protein n=1 Tax=Nannocystis pusilla TaxID=889268 RepID=UPI003B7D99DA
MICQYHHRRRTRPSSPSWWSRIVDATLELVELVDAEVELVELVDAEVELVELVDAGEELVDGRP